MPQAPTHTQHRPARGDPPSVVTTDAHSTATGFGTPRGCADRGTGRTASHLGGRPWIGWLQTLLKPHRERFWHASPGVTGDQAARSPGRSTTPRPWSVAAFRPAAAAAAGRGRAHPTPERRAAVAAREWIILRPHFGWDWRPWRVEVAGGLLTAPLGRCDRIQAYRKLGSYPAARHGAATQARAGPRQTTGRFAS